MRYILCDFYLNSIRLETFCRVYSAEGSVQTGCGHSVFDVYGQNHAFLESNIPSREPAYFYLVRLGARIPVLIQLAHIPKEVQIAAGMICTVVVEPK